MPERSSMLSAASPARINLKTYVAELSLGTLAVGVDNIHHDVFLSPKFVELTGAYLLEFIRQNANLVFLSKSDRKPPDRKAARPPEAGAWKRRLSDLLHAGLQRAKYGQNIEIDLLMRVAMLKFLTQEISAQFANLMLEAKEWIRNRGAHFDHTEQAHVMKARLAELQADRRNVFRQTGQHVFQVILEIEENGLARSRKALFGDEMALAYEILTNRLAFVEGGKDDVLFLEQYVLLGTYLRDQDRFETFDALLLDFLREWVLAGDQGSELSEAWRAHQELVDSTMANRAEIARLEDEHAALARRLERSDGLMARVGLGSDPANLRAAITDVEKRLRHLREKLEASMPRIDEISKKIRRTPREEIRTVALRFAEDLMRLRRDIRNYERLTAAMERVNLVRNERTRENSELNNSLYEFILPEEARPAEDRVLSHTIIKADVRGSTKITQDLLARGLNPASLFSLNFYEPVKKILERYGAAKVFIEGDALVLAIFENESNRAQQRAVSKACALARQILAVSSAFNERAETTELPRLELGIGIAYQGSAPTYWMDTDSRIMISRALNLSDRLSSCSKAAKRLLLQNPSLFRLFLFQTMMEGVAEDEADEFLIRFNLNGVELNEDGFLKLEEEIALTTVEADCVMPWGKERVTFYAGETPVGDGLEPILIRRGYVRQLLPDGKIGSAAAHAYYEVCTSPKVFELVEYLTATATASDRRD